MKKYSKRIITIFLFLILSIFIHYTLRYVLIDDRNSYTRIMMHELYNSEQNIDIAFVGSSHVYRSLVPSVTDEGFGCYTFNAGSSSQYMDGSYAVIKELNKNYDVKTIYLELYYGVADTTNYNDREELTSTYIISDYMRPSIDKIIYLLNASSKKYWVNSFLVERRNWEKLLDFAYIINMIRAKNSPDYQNYQYEKTDNQIEYYVERGFVANDSSLNDEEGWVCSGVPIGVEKMNNKTDWYKSLSDIVEYCNKNDIEIVFFITPMPEATIISTGNYQDYHNYIYSIAEEMNVEFYDFNLCKSEYFNCADGNMFKDSGHLNTTGAYAFSELFAKFFTGKIDEEELFYDSYDEKIENEETKVYGIIRSDKSCEILSNKNEGIIYEVVIYNKNGESKVVIDNDESRVFELPYEEGIIKIIWTNKDGISDEITITF